MEIEPIPQHLDAQLLVVDPRRIAINEFTDDELQAEVARRDELKLQGAIRALDACTTEQARTAIGLCRHGLSTSTR